jgi:DNA-binding protein YbaB
VRPGGQPNMKKLMQLQQSLAKAQAELAETEVSGTAGGGLVTVTMTASGEFRSVKIDSKPSTPTTWRPSRTWCLRRSTTPRRPAAP